MKRVLLICGSFPPFCQVGGIRPAMFAKYLPEFGWEPWILTRSYINKDTYRDQILQIEYSKNIDKQVIRIQYSDKDEKFYLHTRKLLHKCRDFFYPEYSSPNGLFFSARKVGEELLKKHHFDIIFTTSPDQWELTLGSYLSKKYKIPLIADFRDILEQEIGMKRSFREKLQTIRFKYRRYITTRRAVHLTTVSLYHQKTLRSKLKRNTSIVYNGYDHINFFPSTSSNIIDSHFRIIYMGRILQTWYQNPSVLFIAIDELLKEKRIDSSSISVDFYGTDKNKLKTIIEKLDNKDFIRFHERVPYKEVPNIINEAQLLLVLTNNGRQGILTTKFFEYLGVKKPILCIPGDQNELDVLIKKYGLGYSISNVMTLKEKLEEWVILFKSGKFPLHIESDIDFFTRRNQTRILSEVFNNIIDNK